MINIKINKVQIEQTKHTNFLGVIFDGNLCWSNHISYINRKIAKGIGIICRAKKYFNTSALINLYNAFVFPYLINCVEVWGNALGTHIQPLVKLQNKIVRIITYSYHTTEQLYTITRILPLKILVKQRIGLLMRNYKTAMFRKLFKIYINAIEMSTPTSHDKLIISIP